MSTELRQINRKLDSIEEMLSVDDLVNEQEAAKWLGIAHKTLKNKIYDRSLDGTYIVSKAGVRMFYKSKLVQLK